MKSKPKPKPNQIDRLIADIAAKHLLIDSLAVQRTGKDFHEIAVWNVESALRAAYEAGLAAQRPAP